MSTRNNPDQIYAHGLINHDTDRIQRNLSAGQTFTSVINVICYFCSPNMQNVNKYVRFTSHWTFVAYLAS